MQFIYVLFMHTASAASCGCLQYVVVVELLVITFSTTVFTASPSRNPKIRMKLYMHVIDASI